MASIIGAVISGTGNSGSKNSIQANQVASNQPIADEMEKPEMQKPEENKPEESSGGNLKEELIKGGINSLMSQQSNAPQPIQPSTVASSNPIASDENGKCDIRKEIEGQDPIDIFAQIDAYLYKYKPEYQKEYEGTGMTNNDDNFGVMAQDLQANPITQAAVKEDNHGHLALDGGRLSSINTAMISELCKRIEDLESAIYGRS